MISEKARQYLIKRHGKPFYLGATADFLGISIEQLEGVISVYVDLGLIKKGTVCLCPEDRTELDDSDNYYCFSCERNIPEEETVKQDIYTPYLTDKDFLNGD